MGHTGTKYNREGRQAFIWTSDGIRDIQSTQTIGDYVKANESELKLEGDAIGGYIDTNLNAIFIYGKDFQYSNDLNVKVVRDLIPRLLEMAKDMGCKLVKIYGGLLRTSSEDEQWGGLCSILASSLLIAR